MELSMMDKRRPSSVVSFENLNSIRQLPLFLVPYNGTYSENIDDALFEVYSSAERK
jgi:hypothetical protein